MGWDGMDVAPDDDKETCVLWGAHDSGELLMQLDTIIEASWHTHRQLQQRRVLLETSQTKDMGGDTKGAQKDLMTNVLRNLVSKSLCCVVNGSTSPWTTQKSFDQVFLSLKWMEWKLAVKWPLYCNTGWLHRKTILLAVYFFSPVVVRYLFKCLCFCGLEKGWFSHLLGLAHRWRGQPICEAGRSQDTHDADQLTSKDPRWSESDCNARIHSINYRL